MESTENYSNEMHTPEMQTPQRPQFLTVLCILSFIWSGLSLLAFLLGLLLSGMIFEVLERIANGDESVNLDTMQIEGIDKLLEMGQGMFAMLMALCLLLVGASLFGVIKMWNLKKSGFYIYAVVNGLGVIFSLFSMSFAGALFSIAFIVMYGLNLKHMK